MPPLRRSAAPCSARELRARRTGRRQHGLLRHDQRGRRAPRPVCNAALRTISRVPRRRGATVAAVHVPTDENWICDSLCVLSQPALPRSSAELPGQRRPRAPLDANFDRFAAYMRDVCGRPPYRCPDEPQLAVAICVVNYLGSLGGTGRLNADSLSALHGHRHRRLRDRRHPRVGLLDLRRRVHVLPWRGPRALVPRPREQARHERHRRVSRRAARTRRLPRVGRPRRHPRLPLLTTESCCTEMALRPRLHAAATVPQAPSCC